LLFEEKKILKEMNHEVCVCVGLAVLLEEKKSEVFFDVGCVVYFA
jgi:hypothetical protein